MLRRYYPYALAIAVYSGFALYLGKVDPYWCRDAQMYRDWIHFGEFEVSRASYLYPMLLATMRIIGDGFIFVIQLGMLLVSAWLVSESTKYKTVSFLVMALYPSLILISFHAATEMLAILLISAFIYYYEKQKFEYCLGACALLSVTKPVFVPALVGIAVYFLIKKRITVILFVVSFIPYMIQLLISSNTSDVSMIVFRHGFFSYFLNYKTGRSIQEIREFVFQIPTKEMFSFVWQNIHEAYQCYFRLLTENILNGSLFTMGHAGLKKTTWIINEIAFSLSVIVMYHRKVTLPILIVIYLVLISGISIWAGDRYMLPVIPLSVYSIWRKSETKYSDTVL
jgi:hypothetical protein